MTKRVPCALGTFFSINAVKLPVIRKGIPKQPFSGPEVPFVSRIFDIGSNDSVQIGFFVTIECAILQGLPQPNITWFRDGTEIVGAKEQFFLRINVTTVEEAEGNYTCVASNRAGMDSASTLLRSGVGETGVFACCALLHSTSVITYFHWSSLLRMKRYIVKQMQPYE